MEKYGGGVCIRFMRQRGSVAFQTAMGFRACVLRKNTAIIRFLRRVSLHGKLEQRVRGGSQQPTLMRQCQGFGSPPH